MKAIKAYKNKEKALAYRNKQRKINYKSSRPLNKNKRKLYTEYEMFMILNHEKSDREIAKIINRSVEAIQIKRATYKNGTRTNLLKTKLSNITK